MNEHEVSGGPDTDRARADRTPRCGACGRAVADDDPALYELIGGSTVETVILGPDEPLELPPGVALVDIFHPDCFDELVRRWEKREEGSWRGRCPLSGRLIVAPHPLTTCPICGASVVETSVHADSP